MTDLLNPGFNPGNPYWSSPKSGESWYKKQLVVSIADSHWLYDYVIQPDGALAYKQKLYWLHNPGNHDHQQIQRMAFDENGNLYVATGIGVQVCEQNGRVRAILSSPGGTVTHLWFGGEKYDLLYITCGDKCYKRRLKVSGAPSFQKKIIPPSQGGG